MSIYTPTPTLPDAGEAVEALAALLKASSAIVEARGVESADSVFVHYQRAQEAADALPPKFATVFEVQSLGGRRWTVARTASVPVQVRFECDDTLTWSDFHQGVETPHQWLRYMHRQAHAALIGQDLTLGHSEQTLPVSLSEEGVPRHDADDQTFYMNATYHISLHPA